MCLEKFLWRSRTTNRPDAADARRPVESIAGRLNFARKGAIQFLPNGARTTHMHIETHAPPIATTQTACFDRSSHRRRP